MTITTLQIIILAAIQGLAELLPVSSSAHVIAAAKLMHIDPSRPEFTMLLVMLHTGTMFAVIVYFWKAWKKTFFASRAQFNEAAKLIVLATAVTCVIGGVLILGIEHVMKRNNPGASKAEIEELFKNTYILAGGLTAAGVLILVSGLRAKGKENEAREVISPQDSVAIGAIQGLCLPFRGFSRSGATISVGLLRGMGKIRLEEFSFALAVVLTPLAIGWEARRLVIHQPATSAPPAQVFVATSGATLAPAPAPGSPAPGSSPTPQNTNSSSSASSPQIDNRQSTIGNSSSLSSLFAPSLLGMLLSFIAGLIALKLLSRLLVGGQWWVFGVYCLVAAVVVLAILH